MNGTLLGGWLSLEVHNNTFFEADTCKIEFAISALPVMGDYSPNWWTSQQTPPQIEVRMDCPPDPQHVDPGAMASWFLGVVERIELDPVRRLLTITGRDMSYALVEAVADQKILNQRPAALINSIASSYGLTANIPNPDSLYVGKASQDDAVKQLAKHSLWEVICSVAKRSGNVVYMTGKTLNVVAPPTSSQPCWAVNWTEPISGTKVSGDVLSLKFDRDFQIAKGVTVTVECHSLQGGHTITRSYPHPPKKDPYNGVTGTRDYFYRKPKMKPADALEWAKSQYHQIVAHELRVEFEAVGDSLLLRTTPVVVTGTASYFDATYYPDSITRHLSMERGYVMTCHAKTASILDNPQ
ncbi:MAG: hypothetical protein JO142_02270 [Burkholderiales bacterium]|nr:hypothetical protein [Burkholderiales bacterium]